MGAGHAQSVLIAAHNGPPGLRPLKNRDPGGSGGGDAGTGYAMTLSVTAGVLSPNITGLPTSWAAGDSTWTATDDTGAAR